LKTSFTEEIWITITTFKTKCCLTVNSDKFGNTEHYSRRGKFLDMMYNGRLQCASVMVKSFSEAGAPLDAAEYGLLDCNINAGFFEEGRGVSWPKLKHYYYYYYMLQF
jgi:hypothetical protein